MGVPPLVGAHEAMLRRLRDELRKTLVTATSGTTAAALVDFPMHSNVGDLAIWAGELTILRQIGIRIEYVCDVYGYRRERLQAALGPDDPVLLQGGGNFGDLWPGFQRFRERLIDDFPDRRIIQLPQTIYFGTQDAAARTSTVLARHGGVTLIVRDERSRRMARDWLGLDASVCPDSAFALTPAPPCPPVQPVFWLRRTDRERAECGTGPYPSDVEPVDWPDNPGFALLRDAGRVQGRVTGRAPVLGTAVDLGLRRLYESIATRRLRLGLGMVARGRVLVTDRLHAHILACLIGRPNVVVDSGYGKISAFVERWTRSSPLVRSAASHDEGLALARSWHGVETSADVAPRE